MENKRLATNLIHTFPTSSITPISKILKIKAAKARAATRLCRKISVFLFPSQESPFAKDSDFYLMPSYEKNPESIDWNGATSFGAKMLERMTHDACFSNTGRTGDPAGNGFYFPGKKEKWESVLKQIVLEASTHFAKHGNCEGEQAYKLKGAFQEYVYSMIQAYTELKLAKDVGNPSTLVMAIRACKENIDRGGAENAKYMYSRLPADMPHKEKVALITGVLQSRALSARDRVILEKRLPQVLAFMEFVKPEEYQSESKQLMDKLDIKFAAAPVFTPALGAAAAAA